MVESTARRTRELDLREFVSVCRDRNDFGSQSILSLLYSRSVRAPTGEAVYLGKTREPEVYLGAKWIRISIQIDLRI